MDASPLKILSAFLIHNIPSIIMLIILLIAWKKPVVGSIAFGVSGILFAVLFIHRLEDLSNLLLFAFPILMIGGLFYTDWKWR